MDSRDTFGWRYMHLSDANVATGVDTVILTNPGKLHTLTCNSIPTTTGNLSIYDGPSATGVLMAVVEMAFAGVVTPSFPATLIFDAILTTGLTVTCDASLADFDFTITYV